uniref:type II toxin-antitoxin system RelE/ParE family toxin n=1 Tax=Edaphosphingomonas laterariae TaxID=861865 RepID=UPI001181AEBC|nr:hypothetical protein [Sphingomonas laterariae]
MSHGLSPSAGIGHRESGSASEHGFAQRIGRDVDEPRNYYADEAGVDVTIRFIDALERAYRRISARPATGSPRYAHELYLPGLRSHQLAGVPFGRLSPALTEGPPANGRNGSADNFRDDPMEFGPAEMSRIAALHSGALRMER